MAPTYNDFLIVRYRDFTYEGAAEVLHQSVAAKDSVTLHVDLVPSPANYRGFASGGNLLVPYRLTLAQHTKAHGTVISTHTVTKDTFPAIAMNLLTTVGFTIALKDQKVPAPKVIIDNPSGGTFVPDDTVPTQAEIDDDDGA